MPEVVSFQGFDALIAKMQQLSDKPIRNATTRALRKGANVIRDAARANALRLDDPMTKPFIAKNIASASMKRSIAQRRSADVGMRVGVMGGARLKKGDLPLPGGNTTHWRYLEMGTSNVRAQPFMRPAMNENIQAAFAATADALQAEFSKEVTKLAQ